MSEAKDFTVVSFKMFKDIQAQHVRIGLPYDRDEEIRRYLHELCAFLNDHQFAEMSLPQTPEEMPADFALRTSHLNEQGRAFLRRVLTKWTKARNKNHLRVLQRALIQV